MFTILFADDEPYDIEGLKIMIDWQSLGIEIVGEAADGETALELIRKKSPDIVISDICMPRISGTELLERCAKFRVRPEFVMLTGYGDMEYVRTAMKHGAKGYLLKPLDPEEITKTISGICEELSAQRAKRAETEEMLNLVIGETFQKIFSGDTEKETIDKGLFMLGLKQDAPLVLIGYKIAGNNPLGSEDECFKRVLAALPRSGACVFTLGRRHIFVVSTIEDHAVNRAVAEAAIDGCTGVSMVKTKGIEGLSDAYFAVMRSLTKVEEGVTVVRFIKNESVFGIDSGAERVLDTAINGDIDAARSKLRADMQRMKSSRANIDFVRGYAVSLLIIMERYAGMAEMNVEGMLDGALEAISNAYDCDVTQALCEEFLDIFLKSVGSVKNLGSIAMSEKITDYIKRNYAQNLTLALMSRELGVSTGVISRMVKQKTGMKFSDYLNYVRIQNAKKLLRFTNTKITRIAVESGYNDYYYFASKFKELTGGLPSDYRKKRKTWSENAKTQ